MSGPLDKTFEVLATTQDVQAVDTLIYALGVPDEHVQAGAASSVMRRRTTKGHVELIRRFDSLAPSAQSLVESRVSEIESALKQSIIHGDLELRGRGLQLIAHAECYAQVPALLKLMQSEDAECRDLAADALKDLVNRLYEHLHSRQGESSGGRYLRHAPKICHEVLTHLDAACETPGDVRRPDVIVESILILGDPENFAVKKALLQGLPEYRDLACELLFTSTHPGVMQFLCNAMDKNYPPAKAFEAIAKRGDSEFIWHFLNWIPARPTQIQDKNLKQIESVSWLDPLVPDFSAIPLELQPQLIAFVNVSGLPSDQKMEIREWMVRNGSPQGRAAASDILVSMRGQDVQAILFDSLGDEDPAVQAWATSQLRARDIPHAFSVLVEKLQSSEEEVQEAARKELAGFDVNRMINLYDYLDAETCLRAGELIARIDPEYLTKLRKELASPIRQRRLRAAQAAQAMGMQEQVLSGLVTMLGDGDTVVRRTAAEILGTIPSPEARRALESIADDSSPRIREVVQRSLQQLDAVLTSST